eukprot:1181315-Prorocentrum_minimum.AAC.1
MPAIVRCQSQGSPASSADWPAFPHRRDWREGRAACRGGEEGEGGVTFGQSRGPAEGPEDSCARGGTAGLLTRENIPARPASDWSVVRIYPRVLRPIGPS